MTCVEKGFEITAELKLFTEGVAGDADAVALLQFESGGGGEGGEKKGEGTKKWRLLHGWSVRSQTAKID
jgi:hypothetical protein